MRRVMMKRFFLLGMAVTSIVSGMLLTASACPSMFYKIAGIQEAEFNSLMDPTVPVAEHAVLTIDEDMVVTGVDGSLGVIFADGQEETLLMIPPGEHTLSVSYLKVQQTLTVIVVVLT
jgi:hypothetical protein